MKRTLSLLLALLMLLSLLPVSALAEELEEPEAEELVIDEEPAEALPQSADADSSLGEGAIEEDIPAEAEPEASLSEGGVAGEAGDGGSEPAEEEPATEEEDALASPERGGVIGEIADDGGVTPDEEPAAEDAEVFAAEETYAASGTCGNNLTWALDNGRLTISGTGAMEDYSYSSHAPWHGSRSSIKQVVIQRGVTTIGDYAFYFCESLTSVNIPDGVTTIGDEALWSCFSLTSVDIPDSVTSIGSGAFGLCYSLTSVSIPNSVASIGNSAFSDCNSLTSVTIGNGVTSIGYQAFEYCTGLTSVRIPDSVTSIRDLVFNNCTSLTSVTIPDSVTEIGWNAFLDCTSLTDVYYNASRDEWDAIAIGDGNNRLTSATVHFNAADPTQITAQPANATLGIGDTAAFTVKASGKNLKYQWQYIAPGGTWGNWPTAANAVTLSVSATAARSGYKYRCRVTGDGGTVYSSAAQLSIKTQINAQPAAVKTDYGKTATFTVEAIGTNLLYQWQAIAPGGAWKSIIDDAIPSAKTATLKIPANNDWSGYKFRCRVVGDGGAVFTSVAKLTITTQLTAQPAAVTTAYGNTASFTVKAVGTNLQYQWQAIAPGGAWYSILDDSIPSAKTATLKLPANNDWSGYKFRCRVAGDGGAVFTNVVKLTITTKINTQPANATANSGKTAAFTVKAVGTNLQYQWQYIAPGGSGWVSCTETTAKSASLKVSATAAKNGYKYRCRVVGDGGSVYTNVVKLTVK